MVWTMSGLRSRQEILSGVSLSFDLYLKVSYIPSPGRLPHRRSVEFADQPLHVRNTSQTQPDPQDTDPVVPISGAPTTLIEWAVLILNTPHPSLKVSDLDIRCRHAQDRD